MPLLAGLLTIALTTVSSTALAQVRPITGRVTDQQGIPIAGADVEAVRLGGTGFTREQTEAGQGPRWRARTNDRGEFAVRVPSSGSYLVTASREDIGAAQAHVVVELSGLPVVDLKLWKPDAASQQPGCARRAEFPGPIAPTGAPQLDKLFRWLDAVQAHVPGCHDEAAREVGRWLPAEFESLVIDVASLSAFLRWADQQRSAHDAQYVTALEPLAGGQARHGRAQFTRDARGVAWIVLHQRQFAMPAIQKVFNGDATIKRGALLHADIAMFVPGTFNRYVLTQDGRHLGGRPGTVHWLVGRTLLDLIQPAAGDPDALLWYRAASAHLFEQGHLAHLANHLEKAREVFPSEVRFRLETAYLHLELSSPSIQSAADELRDNGIGVTTGSAERELERAEQWLRSALELSPADAEIRLRLGHALDGLRRRADAEVQLRHALDSRPDRRQQYLAHLFLGRIAERAGRRVDARGQYEAAAARYPQAQSPQLALAHLDRASMRSTPARDALQSIMGGGLSEAERDDPWLYYYKPLLGTAAPLMRDMRQRLAGEAK